MCEDKKSCITINCGCCSNRNDMELLFEGTMNTPDVIYDLQAPITDYKYIIVEAGMHKAEEGYWTKVHELIPSPEVSDNYFEYGKIIHIEPNSLGRHLIYWHFPTATTLKVDFIDKRVGMFDDVRIGKIYGVK
jgi:hypothetical protein